MTSGRDIGNRLGDIIWVAALITTIAIFSWLVYLEVVK